MIAMQSEVVERVGRLLQEAGVGPKEWQWALQSGEDTLAGVLRRVGLSDKVLKHLAQGLGMGCCDPFENPPDQRASTL
jgi:hypothetical protein